MEMLNRRRFLPLLFLAAPALGMQTAAPSVEGTLTAGPDGRAALRTADGRLVFLDGDKSTVGVLKDARLKGADFEALDEHDLYDETP